MPFLSDFQEGLQGKAKNNISKHSSIHTISAQRTITMELDEKF